MKHILKTGSDYIIQMALFFSFLVLNYGVEKKKVKVQTLEKIFLMILTNQLIYLVNVKTMKKIFFKLYVLLKKSELYRLYFAGMMMQPVMMAPMPMMQQPMMMGGPMGSSTLDHELAGDELSVSLLFGVIL